VSFHRRAKEHVPGILRPALEELFNAIDTANRRKQDMRSNAIDAAIKSADRKIAQLGKKYENVEVLSQPNGVVSSPPWCSW
jgi:hypothetical protein